MTHVHLSLHDLSQLVVMQAQNGRNRNEIVRTLIERGWPEKSAARFVDMTLSEHEELLSHPPVPEPDQQPSNEAFPNEQEVWRMLFFVALAVTLIVLFSVLQH